MNYFWLLLLSVFIASFSQVLLKFSSKKKYSSKIREYLNIHVISAYGLFFLSTFLSIWAYRYLDLKYAPMVQAFGYIFILLYSKFIFKEKINRYKLIGLVLIVLGITIFNL
ncbi:EamA family transporter [Candidatus Harpocratesius sp.]